MRHQRRGLLSVQQQYTLKWSQQGVSFFPEPQWTCTGLDERLVIEYRFCPGDTLLGASNASTDNVIGTVEVFWPF